MLTGDVDRKDDPTKRPLRVAVVFDVMTHRSHANVILENFLEPYYFDGAVVDPREDFQIISLCADHPEGHEESEDPVRRKDMSKAVAREYGIRLYDTIAAALCAGGEQLAVDAVLSIGEGGGGDKYGYTELGQPKYPRKRFFDEIVAVFRKSGRAVPVFSDKHLSYSWAHADEMVCTSKQLGFEMMAGSSLPFAEQRPPLNIPPGASITGAVAIHGHAVEVYDFHALELLQAKLERRDGSHAGVAAVQFLEGDKVIAATADGRISTELVSAAMAAEDVVEGTTYSAQLGRDWELAQTTVRQRDIATNSVIHPNMRFSPDGSVQKPHAILLRYADGLRAAVVRIGDDNLRWNFACQLKDEVQVRATRYHVGPWRGRWGFKAFSHAIQHFIKNQCAPVPVERTLLVTGILEAAMQSRHSGGVEVRTPHLEFGYESRDFDRFCEHGRTWRLLDELSPSLKEPQAALARFEGLLQAKI